MKDIEVILNGYHIIDKIETPININMSWLNYMNLSWLNYMNLALLHYMKRSFRSFIIIIISIYIYIYVSYKM